MVVGLQQRLLSSVEAFARTLLDASPDCPTSMAEQPKKTATLRRLQIDSEEEPHAFVKAARQPTSRRAELDPGRDQRLTRSTLIREITAAARPSDVTPEQAAWEREQRTPPADAGHRRDGTQRSRRQDAAGSSTGSAVTSVRSYRISAYPSSARPPSWTDRRVLIFTENREGTKRYLKSTLEHAITG